MVLRETELCHIFTDCRRVGDDSYSAIAGKCNIRALPLICRFQFRDGMITAASIFDALNLII